MFWTAAAEVQVLPGEVAAEGQAILATGAAADPGQQGLPDAPVAAREVCRE